MQMPQLVAFARLGLVRCALQTRPATGQEGALEEEGAEAAAGGLGGTAVQVQVRGVQGAGKVREVQGRADQTLA